MDDRIILGPRNNVASHSNASVTDRHAWVSAKGDYIQTNGLWPDESRHKPFLDSVRKLFGRLQRPRGIPIDTATCRYGSKLPDSAPDNQKHHQVCVRLGSFGCKGERRRGDHRNEKGVELMLAILRSGNALLKGKVFILSLLALPSIAAHAATCEEGFQFAGDVRTGLTFVGRVEKPGLGIQSALGQLQKFAADEKFEVGKASIQGDKGEVFFTQTTNNPPIVVRATADSSGTVLLGTKLAPQQRMPLEAARGHICGMLNALKTGAEGEAIAAKGAAAPETSAGTEQVDSRKVIDAKAVELSKQIGRELQEASLSLRRKSQVKNLLLGKGREHTQRETANIFSPIVNKYMGRRYRVDGELAVVTESRHGALMSASFLVTGRAGLLGIRESRSSNNHNFSIRCVFADEDRKIFSTLLQGDRVTLTGTVVEFFPGNVDGAGHSLLGAGMALYPCKP
jgi:hypothetical protein